MAMFVMNASDANKYLIYALLLIEGWLCVVVQVDVIRGI